MQHYSVVRQTASIFRSLVRALGASDAKTRYMARYGLVRHLANHWGFELYNNNLVWHNDLEYATSWSQFQENDGYVQDRKFVLHSMARAVRDLPGDSAECGVFAGAGSFLICLAMGSERGRQHHVFDSFEGLSEPDREYDQPLYDYTYRWFKHDLAVPLQIVKSNLSDFNHIRYYKGWIPERFHEVADRKFAFVHVDVDLYKPTRDSLCFFYERLVPGGILLCDDYGSAACPGAKQAFDELIWGKSEQRVIHLTTGQGFIVKR